MAVHLRLRRMGAKKRAYFRIVAADSRRSRDGRFLEILGTYNPITKPARLSIREDLVTKWLNDGAIPSDTVNSLLAQIGFNDKYRRALKGEDVSEVQLKTEITERRKKTRKMKKAEVAAAEAKQAEATAAETATKADEPGEEKSEEKSEEKPEEKTEEAGS